MSRGTTDNQSTASKAQTAPDPDDPRKPDDPTDLTKRSWKYILRKTMREFMQDQCLDLAAALTFFSVLALFPALLALLSILGLFSDPVRTTETLLTIVGDVAPESVVDTMRGPIEQMAGAPNATLTFAIGLAAALWSASAYVGALGRALNRVYEVDEGRPIWKLRPAMLLVTIVTVLLVVVIVVSLVLTGPVAQAVGEVVGLGGTAVTVWNIAKWPVVLALIVLVVAILYYATPNIQQPKFRWMSPGALLAIATAVIASVGFGFYVSSFGNYDRTYGSLGGVIVFLLWLWIMNLALLFGAEFDSELERGRQLQGGIAAEESLQLPPRDTTKSEKNDAKAADDVRRGRAIRISAAAARESDREVDGGTGGASDAAKGSS